MITQQQINQHTIAIALLSAMQNCLEIMQVSKEAHDAHTDPVLKNFWSKKYDHYAAERMSLSVKYHQILKELFAPFSADVDEPCTPPEPQIARISAVELSETFYNHS